MRWDGTPVRFVLAAAAMVSAICPLYTQPSGRDGSGPTTSDAVRPPAVDPQAQVCVVEGDSLRMLTVMRSPAGDTLVNGLPFRERAPDQQSALHRGSGVVREPRTDSIG